MAMKTYIIHATCRYVVQSKADGRCENGQNRPTISIDASSEKAAISRATRQQKKAISSEWWPCISFTLIPELVTVIEHSTPAQRRVLVRFYSGDSSGANQAMLNRLVAKGWLEGSTKDGYRLTSAGVGEIGR